MAKHKISIVIPILNEAETISKLLQHLTTHSSKENIADIIIVDGGSLDGSQDIVKSFTFSDHTYGSNETNPLSIRLEHSKKGRARQMNVGAKASSGNILYFLHADSFPPKHFDQLIIDEIEKGNHAGCFKMKFDDDHWWLRLAGWLTQFRWRACRGGDQSQFITKSLFESLGKFNESFIIYEDNDLINKLYAIDKFVVIQEWLTTSARRYENNGIWKLQYHFWTIYVKKWFGASAEDLHDYYLRHIV